MRPTKLNLTHSTGGLFSVPARLCAVACLLAMAPWVFCSPVTAQKPDYSAKLDLSNPPPFAAQVRACVEDAELNQLAIVSEDRLVAVGDRGLILISDSGGNRWQSIASPTTDALHAVAISADGKGIAVGGRIGNFSRISRSAILQTTDGGATWTQVIARGLPRLTGAVLAAGRLMAWGDYSPSQETSCFESLDWGSTWHPVPLPLGHISAATLTSDGRRGAVDRLGNSIFKFGQRESIPLTDFDTPIHAIKVVGKRWIACGSQGTVITSTNGVTWSNVELPLSPEAQGVCKWTDICQVGPEIWIGGAPGSILLYSSDAGASWEVRKTGHRLPIKSLQFKDSNRGWAVSGLGAILATRDGGQTWYAQREQAQRLGVLEIAQSIDHLVWQPLVAAAWDSQVAAAGLALERAEPIQQADFLPSQEAQMVDAVPNLGLVQLDFLDGPSNSSVAVAERIAMQLMTWQPDVVLAAEESGQSKVSQEIRRAMRLAAQTAQTDVAQQLGLPPWQVKKLVRVTDAGSQQYSESSQRVLRGSAAAIVDLLVPLPVDVLVSLEPIPMRSVWAQSQSVASTTALMGAIPPSAETARYVEDREVGNYQLVMGRVHRQRTLAQLAIRDDSISALTPWSGQDVSDEQWAKRLRTALRSMPEAEVAPAVFRLVKQLEAPADWSRREAALLMLTRIQATSDAADWARLELLRCSASDELRAWASVVAPVAMPLGDAQKDKTIQTAAASGGGESRVDADTAVWNRSPFGSRPGGSPAREIKGAHVVSASATRNIRSSNDNASIGLASPALPLCLRPRQQWYGQMQALTRDVAELQLRPDTSLLIRSTRSQRGIGAASFPAEVTQLSRSRSIIGWPQMANQEMLLAAGTTDQLKWLATASRASTPPILDGKIDDDCWNNQRLMRLESTAGGDTRSGNQSTSVLWSYDDKYLYIAAVCRRAQAKDAKAVKTLRQYDSDLSTVDRVEFSIDTDRDYATCITLAVAEDGRTLDRCDGMVGYNPTWYVAVQPAPDYWVAEVAIERAALTTLPVQSGTAWAVTASRSGPGVEHESWSRLRTKQALPQAAGLLVFTGAGPVKEQFSDKPSTDLAP